MALDLELQSCKIRPHFKKSQNSFMQHPGCLSQVYEEVGFLAGDQSKGYSAGADQVVPGFQTPLHPGTLAWSTTSRALSRPWHQSACNVGNLRQSMPTPECSGPSVRSPDVCLQTEAPEVTVSIAWRCATTST